MKYEQDNKLYDFLDFCNLLIYNKVIKRKGKISMRAGTVAVVERERERELCFRE